MTEDKLKLIQLLIRSIPTLTHGQLVWVNRVIEVFNEDHEYTLLKSDYLNESVLKSFGDAMRIHHSFSAEPFSKDKFEYVLVEVLKIDGRNAALAPKGNPGHDITVDEIKISLKTQANKGIKNDLLWVSKFMELGKGNWSDNPKELEGLRKQFIVHLKSYDKILSLRTLQKAPHWKYELVEIPKKLLALANGGKLEMKLDSRQSPKPGYCYVFNNKDQKAFDLYFDGGTERKLQIKNLRKDLCKVHATWKFFIP